VLNDFVAIGYAVPTLTADDVLPINDVPVEPGAPIAVLGPGTGLGETQLFWDTGASGYTAFASEVRPCCAPCRATGDHSVWEAGGTVIDHDWLAMLPERARKRSAGPLPAMLDHQCSRRATCSHALPRGGGGGVGRPLAATDLLSRNLRCQVIALPRLLQPSALRGWCPFRCLRLARVQGSHAGFAPRGELQRELLAFAEEELEMPCEVEHVACGAGLKRIYRFLCDKEGQAPEHLVRH
jgi:Glucokinase